MTIRITDSIGESHVAIPGLIEHLDFEQFDTKIFKLPLKTMAMSSSCFKMYSIIPKWLAILLPLWLSSFYLMAQKSYQPGYILLGHQDTLHGLINASNANQSARYCLFKTNESATPVQYYPDDIDGYFVEGNRCYVAKTFFRNQLQIQRFLEYLVDGTIDLYYLADQDSDYFYLEKDGTMYELDNREATILKDGKRYKKPSYAYRSILRVIMKDAYPIFDLIEDADFHFKDLVHVTEKYLEFTCPDEPCITYRNQRDRLDDGKVTIKLGVGLGAEFAKYHLSGELKQLNRYTLIGNEPNSIFGEEIPLKIYDVTLFEDFEAQQKFMKTIVLPAISILVNQGFTTSYQFDLSYGSVTFEEALAEVQVSTLKLSAGYKQEFLFHKRTRPYITLGLAAGSFLSYQVSGFTLNYGIPRLPEGQKEIQYELIENQKGASNIFDKRVRLGYYCGIGLSYTVANHRKVFLEFRYHNMQHQRGYTALDQELRSTFSNVEKNLQIFLWTYLW